MGLSDLSDPSSLKTGLEKVKKKSFLKSWEKEKKKETQRWGHQECQ